MKWSDIPFRPSPRTLRQFAGLWLVFFFGLAVLLGPVRGHQQAGVVIAVLAVVVGLPGLIRPAAVRWIFVGWMVLAFPIGWVVSQTMLGLLFFGLFTPVALFFRLKGRDLLGLRPEEKKSSYWSAKHTAREGRSYFHQY